MSDFSLFRLKHFELFQNQEVFKIGTDAFVLGAWIDLDFEPHNILDLGTGTGVLSLMMAQKFPNAIIKAVDNNPSAVALAERNFRHNALGVNCSAHLADFSAFHDNVKYDLIISNPPFFLNALQAENQVNARAKHLDNDALDSFFKTIATNLADDGFAAVIHPETGQFEVVAAKYGLYILKQLKVYGTSEKLIRTCNLYGFTPKKMYVEQLVIRDSTGQYTKEYKRLTADLHGVQL